MRKLRSLGEWVAADPPASSKPPGPILLAFTVVPVLVLLCVHYGWWPSPFGDFRWLDPLLVSAAALFILAVVGLVWAIRTLYVLGQDRCWSWWILPAPIVVVGAVAVVMLVPQVSFLDKSGEFETVALDLLENLGRVAEQLEIGPFDIRRARVAPPDEVYFIDNDSMFATSRGWVYSPAGTPSGFGAFSATHLSGPWYEFTAIWRD
ncbi:DUF1109 domain-containing protein [Rhodococcus sp. KBW08]|uniref:DUF1109 domain-containing protein n=1 Tax=Rhodococcus sp. KBW08 TaxID=2144188 RepID=UPI000F594843|nr:DUF1109 domain-containing protein [Rhodococcus sp. KBW08]RQO52768.1 DUF1109 domain-containing protein [Rhodococcus sp. KBW08]